LGRTVLTVGIQMACHGKRRTQGQRIIAEFATRQRETGNLRQAGRQTDKRRQSWTERGREIVDRATKKDTRGKDR